MTPDDNFAAVRSYSPPAPTPMGVYKPFLIVGNYCYLSGHGTLKEDGHIHQRKGRSWHGYSRSQTGSDSRWDWLYLRQLKQTFGTLNKIKRVIKVLGMVNCIADLKGIPMSSTDAVNCLQKYGVRRMALV
jgi:hypothetical protein